MLTQQEKKKIITYGVLLKLAVPSLIMAFIPSVIWFLLTMIDDLIFASKSGPYMLGLWVYLGFTAFYLLIFCYSVLRVKFGTSGKKWKNIIGGKTQISQDLDMHPERVAAAVGAMAIGRHMKDSSKKSVSNIGKAVEIAGAVETIDVAMDQVGAMSDQVHEVAKYYHLTIPSVKKWIIIMMILPFIVMNFIYIPRFAASNKNKHEEIAIVKETQNKIVSSFDNYFKRVRVDDPTQRIRSVYSVYGYLENEENVYMCIDLKSDGTVKEIYYHMDAANDKSKEENIEIFNSYVKEESSLLQNTGIDTNDLARLNQVPEEAAYAYVNAGEEDIFVSNEVDDRYYTFSYKTDDGTTCAYFFYTVKLK